MADPTRFVVLPADTQFDVRPSLASNEEATVDDGTQTNFSCPNIHVTECGGALVACSGITG